jgi:hypothetical protein
MSESKGHKALLARLERRRKVLGGKVGDSDNIHDAFEGPGPAMLVYVFGQLKDLGLGKAGPRPDHRPWG